MSHYLKSIAVAWHSLGIQSPQTVKLCTTKSMQPTVASVQTQPTLIQLRVLFLPRLPSNKTVYLPFKLWSVVMSLASQVNLLCLQWKVCLNDFLYFFNSLLWVLFTLVPNAPRINATSEYSDETKKLIKISVELVTSGLLVKITYASK